jgi:methylated-DNA-[protein]-cysteine S-methyltransferase
LYFVQSFRDENITKMAVKFIYNSPIGKLLFISSDKGIAQISFLESDIDQAAISSEAPLEIVKQFDQFFDNNLTKFDLKLDLKGTAFQKKIWKILLEIPYGTTLSYLKVAQKIGDTKKVRAVAGAIAKNPILIVIPCHRVIGSDGKLIGYSGGIERKKALLKLEGFQFQNSLF